MRATLSLSFIYPYHRFSRRHKTYSTASSKIILRMPVYIPTYVDETRGRSFLTYDENERRSRSQVS